MFMAKREVKKYVLVSPNRLDTINTFFRNSRVGEDGPVKTNSSVSNMFLSHFSDDGGHLQRQLSSKCISKYSN